MIKEEFWKQIVEFEAIFGVLQTRGKKERESKNSEISRHCENTYSKSQQMKMSHAYHLTKSK